MPSLSLLNRAPGPTPAYQANSFGLNRALPHLLPLIALCSFSSRALIFVCDNIFICLYLFNICLFLLTVSPSKAGFLFTISLLYAQHLEQPGTQEAFKKYVE